MIDRWQSVGLFRLHAAQSSGLSSGRHGPREQVPKSPTASVEQPRAADEVTVSEDGSLGTAGFVKKARFLVEILRENASLGRRTDFFNKIGTASGLKFYSRGRIPVWVSRYGVSTIDPRERSWSRWTSRSLSGMCS